MAFAELHSRILNGVVLIMRKLLMSWLRGGQKYVFSGSVFFRPWRISSVFFKQSGRDPCLDLGPCPDPWPKACPNQTT